MENPNQNDGLNRLAGAAEKFIKQERWSRRWTNLLKLAVVAYIIVTLVMLTRQIPSEQEMLGTDKHVAIVKLEGAIMPGTYTSAENSTHYWTKPLRTRIQRPLLSRPIRPAAARCNRR